METFAELVRNAQDLVDAINAAPPRIQREMFAEGCTGLPVLQRLKKIRRALGQRRGGEMARLSFLRT